MPSYRPIGDTWWLARAKLLGGRKLYGAFPGGFLERARVLLGVHIDDPVLHVCGGHARHYPYAGGFGPNDRTLDLNPNMEPDFLQDARDPLPGGFRAMLADPPYSLADAEKYVPGPGVLPTPRQLLAGMHAALRPGQRFGILHLLPPRPPPATRFVAMITVAVGFDNRPRTFSVYEKGRS